MSDVTFRPIKRERIPLLLGVAGGTGSGKTFSALTLARGISNGQPFAGIDTENGRMSHYADLFPEAQVAQIGAPFRPEKYADAIEAADQAGYPVVVVDSASHEWYGDGGCLDWHDELMAGDQKKNLSAWIEPKKSHKRMATRLLQLRAHVILCFRAEPKVEAVKKPDGRIEIVPKASLTGLDGWIPIAEKNLPYELTASFLLMADRPGVPRPIKLQEQHKPFVPLDRPLDEQVGASLAAWAAGSSTSSSASVIAGEVVDELIEELLELADRIGNRDAAEEAVAKKRAASSDAVFASWLKTQLDRARVKVTA
jgi:AAA domain